MQLYTFRYLKIKNHIWTRHKKNRGVKMGKHIQMKPYGNDFKLILVMDKTNSFDKWIGSINNSIKFISCDIL